MKSSQPLDARATPIDIAQQARVFAENTSHCKVAITGGAQTLMRKTILGSLTSVAWAAAAVAALLTLASCATIPPMDYVADSTPNHASLTFFRQRHFGSSGLTAVVVIDGKGAGYVRNGQVFATSANPGDLKIEVVSDSDFRSLALPFHAEAGKDYFIEIMPQSAYIGLPGGAFFVIPRERGPVSACNTNWCVVVLAEDEAKSRIAKLTARP